jgi:hypothetical protein
VTLAVPVRGFFFSSFIGGMGLLVCPAFQFDVVYYLCLTLMLICVAIMANWSTHEVYIRTGILFHAIRKTNFSPDRN